VEGNGEKECDVFGHDVSRPCYFLNRFSKLKSTPRHPEVLALLSASLEGWTAPLVHLARVGRERGRPLRGPRKSAAASG